MTGLSQVEMRAYASASAVKDACVKEYFTPKIILDEPTLARYGDAIMAQNGLRAIRVSETAGRKPVSVVFVARHADVQKVLSDENTFRLDHYRNLLGAIDPSRHMLLENDWGERAIRRAILKAAAQEAAWFQPDSNALQICARNAVDELLESFCKRRAPGFDIVGEYGFFAPYLVANRVFGVPGPRAFDLLAWFIVWLKNDPLKLPFTWETGPFLRQSTWAQLSFAQLFANFENREFLIRFLAMTASKSLRRQIEVRRRQVSRQLAEGSKPSGSASLLAALLQVRSEFPQLDEETYSEHLTYLLLETLGTALVLPGLAFVKGVERLVAQTNGAIGLGLDQLNEQNKDCWVNETLRLAPPAPFIMRIANEGALLEDIQIRPGEYVCTLVGRAGMDGNVFPDPGVFNLTRPGDAYLNFGPSSGPHGCFGRHLAPAMLGEMFLGLKRLHGLSAAGVMKKFKGVPVHMPFRFEPWECRNGPR